MKLLALLLRVFLCLTLVADGVGYAQASARMTLGHVTHGGPVRAVDRVDADRSPPPCHGHAGPEQSNAVATVGHDATSIPDEGSGTAPDECCKGKTCRCACMHASCAVIAEVVVQRLGPLAPHVAVLVVDRPQPRVAHLIRPPIG